MFCWTKWISAATILIVVVILACGSEASPQVGPTSVASPIPTTVSTDVPTANPIPTATFESTTLQTSVPAPASLPATVPPVIVATVTFTDSTTLPSLEISEVPEGIPDYDRGDWKHWIDVDRDCQNTRAEVLIAESVAQIEFRDDRQCTVDTGQWLALYTGTVVIEAGDLDIDHMVPLASAHKSGGWAWNPQEKEDYANDLSFDGHLIAVTASANRSKRAKGPEEWKPPDRGYWCEYAVNWITVKAAWDLSATAGEWTSLEEMLDTCADEVTVEKGEAIATVVPSSSTPEPSPTHSPAGNGCGVGQVDVNAAPTKALELIIHIGPSRAAEMLALRPFSSLDDLTRVQGISLDRLDDIVAQGIACIGG